ncbi:MAG: TlpA disulfide reductase family protein [Planctomycetota bacterium]|nr:TlpA disulfide reductase family protein [Planctomycetota bacterium]
MRFASWTGLALLVLSAVGCNNSPVDRINSNSVGNSAVEQSDVKTSELAAPQVNADIKSWEQIQQWVASQHGKVVVVDVWSTSCVPCVKEFPHFVALHEELAGEIACASVNIDYYGGENEKPEDLKPRILEFLTSRGASMQNFISSDPDEDVYKQIATAAIPAVLVYDRGGKLHTTFNNDELKYGPEGFNYADDITPLVRQLLAPDE